MVICGYSRVDFNDIHGYNFHSRVDQDPPNFGYYTVKDFVPDSRSDVQRVLLDAANEGLNVVVERNRNGKIQGIISIG